MDLQLRELQYKLDIILKRDDDNFLALRDQAVTLQNKLNDDRVRSAETDLQLSNELQ